METLARPTDLARFDSVPLSLVLPGFEVRVMRQALWRLQRGFQMFRRMVRGKRYVVLTYRKSIDIDGVWMKYFRIENACASRSEALTEVQGWHDAHCEVVLLDRSGLEESGPWVVAGHQWPMDSSLPPVAGPVRSLRCVKSCATRFQRGWYEIEYVCVTGLELPAGEDPVAAVLAEESFLPYRSELIERFEAMGR